MTAPPPPGLPGTRAYHGAQNADPAAILELFASARPPRRPTATRRPHAYARQGDPRGLVLTADQWESYDEFQALQARQDRKYGHLRARAMMNRGMW